jgi:hypothetical protein
MTHRADNRGLPGRLEWVSEKVGDRTDLGVWGADGQVGTYRFVRRISTHKR